jgi:hypothetical protein
VTRVSQSPSLHRFRCESDNAAEFGLAFLPIPPNDKSKELAEETPVAKYLQRLYLEEGVSQQPLFKNGAQADQAELELEGRLMSGCRTVQAYEESKHQAAARAAIDFGLVLKHAAEHRTAEDCDQAAFVKGLLRWFKRDFFSWHHRPKCTNPGCNIEGEPPSQVESLGVGPPSEEERSQGWAGRTEISRCLKCGTQLRFPRINNPAMLLKTRSGRCGEFANCFCLICRAVGLDARWVMDFSDHVWVEVWIESRGRYVHADPCEISLDAPMLYEAGWNKKLSYIFSFSRCGVVDSMSRYSRQWTSELFERRVLATEKFVKQTVGKLDKHIETQHTMRQLNSFTALGGIEAITAGESWLDRAALGAIGFEGLSDSGMDVLLRRKQRDAEELSMCLFLKSKVLTADEKQGRISGDKTWRAQRGELGASGGSQLDMLPPCDLSEKVSWLAPGLLLGASTRDADRHFDLFVSSTGMDDKLDNGSSGFTSNILDLHCSRSMAPAAASRGVISHGAVSVNGVPVCAASRGHNVVVLCAFTGALVASKAFDTWGDSAAGQMLVDFLGPFLPPLCVSSVSCASTSEETKQIHVTDSSEQGVIKRYIIVVTVLDSGENAGKAVEDLVKALGSSDHQRPRPRLTRHSGLREVPGHRESWALVAATGIGGGADCEVLYMDGCESGKGPCMTRMRIPLLDLPAGGRLLSGVECRGADVEVMAVSRVMSAADGETREAFIARVKDLCMAEKSCRGCVVSADFSQGALFGDSSYPPIPLSQTENATPTTTLSAFIKYLDCPDAGVATNISSLSTNSELSRYPDVQFVKYVGLDGGGHHGDTAAFDCTIGPLSMRDFLSSCSNGPATLRLDRVSFFGGRSHPC